ncbi:hypothetical protein CEXT_99321 [Caerostris extrusa]|uniref:Uncharacterized protein n=1 Tax=Caerostris extrusa TaxID=172846 RepID=A0AAV4XGK1_CAEEX|nr:hypothetical protein CEXT_99321 [Caerostris extrusa]
MRDFPDVLEEDLWIHLFPCKKETFLRHPIRGPFLHTFRPCCIYMLCILYYIKREGGLSWGFGSQWDHNGRMARCIEKGDAVLEII